MILRQIILLQIWKVTADSDFYLQPTENIEINGTESTKIHCQTKFRARQVSTNLTNFRIITALVAKFKFITKNIDIDDQCGRVDRADKICPFTLFCF